MSTSYDAHCLHGSKRTYPRRRFEVENDGMVVSGAPAPEEDGDASALTIKRAAEVG